MQQIKVLIAVLIPLAELVMSFPAFAEDYPNQFLFLKPKNPELSSTQEASGCFLKTSDNRVFDLSHMCSPDAAKDTSYSGHVVGGLRIPSRFGTWYCDDEDKKAGRVKCEDNHYPGFN